MTYETGTNLFESTDAPGDAPGEAARVMRRDLDVFHNIEASVASWAAWETIAHLLLSGGAEIVSVRLDRGEAGFHLRCRLACIDADRARGVVGELADAGLVRGVRLEHLMLSRRA